MVETELDRQPGAELKAVTERREGAKDTHSFH